MSVVYRTTEWVPRALCGYVSTVRQIGKGVTGNKAPFDAGGYPSGQAGKEGKEGKGKRTERDRTRTGTEDFGMAFWLVG